MDKIKPGRYVVAVSGGVDSMVLLDMLRQQPGLSLVVAHADHGIRADSHKDCELVENYAKQHGLLCITTQLKLGARASEERAREARYAFLQQCRKSTHADAIILAHHQDDLIETAIIAIMRGTGWRGLAPFVSNSKLVRPLLNTTKDQLIGYARKHGVPWREDVTNTNQQYLRNYARHNLVPVLNQKSTEWRAIFLQQIRKQQILRQQIEHEIMIWLQSHAQIQNNQITLRRYDLIMLDESITYELLQQICKVYTGNTLERPLAENALIFAKVARPHKIMQLGASWQLRVTVRDLIVEPRTPMVS